jgi:hypothetical protein
MSCRETVSDFELHRVARILGHSTIACNSGAHTNLQVQMTYTSKTRHNYQMPKHTILSSPSIYEV